MSEKRFVCGLGFPINSDDPIRIISDSVEDKDYYKFSDICNVLNEQQVIISSLQQKIDAYERLITNSYEGKEENLDGEYDGMYVIWESELKEWRKKYE